MTDIAHPYLRLALFGTFAMLWRPVQTCKLSALYQIWPHGLYLPSEEKLLAIQILLRKIFHMKRWDVGLNINALNIQGSNTPLLM